MKFLWLWVLQEQIGQTSVRNDIRQYHPQVKASLVPSRAIVLMTLCKSRDVSDLLGEILLAMSLSPSWEGTALHNSVHLFLFTYV